MLNNSIEYCPKCKKSLQGEEIPKEHQKSYNAIHFSNKIGIYNMELDRVTQWQCPLCKFTWKRNN